MNPDQSQGLKLPSIVKKPIGNIHEFNDLELDKNPTDLMDNGPRIQAQAMDVLD